ncbi:MAG: DUF6513 domain-containing protein, partial [Planctomycetota bacterium]|nr:DUF6513 domain-containing protein [Planctomycetota bacterium]
MTYRHIHFVTGRLAEHALRDVVSQLQVKVGFQVTIDVLPITVAALMTPTWIAKHLAANPDADLVLLPGYCQGDLTVVQERTQARVQCGPKDLLALPEFFGQAPDRTEYGQYAIEILAEINHAGQLELPASLELAKQLVRDGADLVDLGCSPDRYWPGVGDCVRQLRDAGIRVSIDSFDRREVEAAVKSGAELVLSVNSTNREYAADWGCEVVAIPDQPQMWESLTDTIDYLTQQRVPFRIDPILEPIGFGFAQSMGRYLRARSEFPSAKIMMGIGNLTELTDVDSAGINTLLLGFCAELQIESVLTTQVIPWASTSVRECDLARRLVHFAVQRRTLPKHLEPQLVTLRDPRRYELGPQRLHELSQQIRDHNYRLFAESGEIHLL